MTLEASLVLPLFIFFFANIMTLFGIVRAQSEIEAALHQTGNEICERAFDLRFGEGVFGEENDGESTGIDSLAGAAGVAFAASKVRGYLGKEEDNGCISGGRSGISFLNSRILLEGDIVDIVADYKVHPIIPIIGFKEFPVEGRYYGHAWTGYDLSDGFANEEIAEEMEIPVERVKEIQKISQEPVSLETPIGEEEDSHLGDFLPDEDIPAPSEAAASTILKEQLVEVLGTLTDREQKVLRLRFGLDDGRARTLEEVGKEFKVTRERIRQIEAKALRKLRHPSRSRKLREFLE